MKLCLVDDKQMADRVLFKAKGVGRRQGTPAGAGPRRGGLRLSSESVVE